MAFQFWQEIWIHLGHSYLTKTVLSLGPVSCRAKTSNSFFNSKKKTSDRILKQKQKEIFNQMWGSGAKEQ